MEAFNNALDCFVRDVFDTSAMSSACLLLDGTRVNLEGMSAHPLLLKNLCFVHVWEALLGASPARSEFDDYSGAHPTACADVDLCDIMVSHILKHTALALVAATPVMQHRVSAVRMSMPVIRARMQTDAAVLHAALADKLCKRFTGSPTAADAKCDTMMQVVQLYAHLTEGDVVRFYADAADRMRADESLWLVNPITGSLLPRPEEQQFVRSLSAATEITCADAMRRRLSHDAHMLRRSWNRTLVVDDDAEASAIVAAALNDGPEDGHAAVLMSRHACPLVRMPSVLPDFWRCYVTVSVMPSSSSTSSVSTCVGRASYLLLWGTPPPTPEGATPPIQGGYTRVIHVLTSSVPRPISHTIAPNVFVLLFAPAPWLRDLMGAMLRRHIAHPVCPTLSKQPGDAVLLFEQALLLMAADGLLLEERATREVDHPLGPAWPISPVVIDTRARPASTVLALHLTLANLAAGHRHVVVFCTRANKQYFELALSTSAELSDPRLTVTIDDSLPPLNEPGPFDVERHYNALMTSPYVWTALDRLGVRLALTVQDDGVLIRPGIDAHDHFKGLAYIGAPWPDVPSYAVMKMDGNTHLVGNGGISLRDVRVMLQIVNDPRLQRESRRLLFDHAQLVPEDVHFGWGVGAVSAPVCPYAVARAFGAEQVVPQDLRSLPFSLHKPWAYWQVDVTRRVMDAIVRGVRDGEDP